MANTMGSRAGNREQCQACLTDTASRGDRNARSLGITGEVIRQKWTAFADLAGIPEEDRLKLSDSWLGKFKIRNGLREFKRHGDAASSDAKTIEEERKRVQELIKKYGYKLRDIFNMDETGLFYGYAMKDCLEVCVCG